MANRYTRALKQIKDATLDEKLKLLEELPTNNTAGLYTDVPGTETPEELEPGDIIAPLNLEQDGDGSESYAGTDTTGLFDPNGTIRAVEPPGDTTAILGPMISMWYAWANYTQIGYVRESDRRMVNLGRIVGEMSDWDGESGFTAYGQLTLAQAVWFKEQTRQDYKAFYPGPPSSPADEYGRYTGSIVATSKDATTFVPRSFFPGTNRTYNATDNFSLQQGQLVAGYGLRPDGTSGYNKVGDVVPDHFGNPMKLVPRPGYGYNMWVPIKKAGGGGYNVAAGGVPRNTGGKSATEEPKSLMQKGLEKKQRDAGPMAPMPTPKQPTGGNMPMPPARDLIDRDPNRKFLAKKNGKGNKKQPVVAHHEPSGKVLTEGQKKALRNVKKPVQVKEIPTKVKVKPTSRKNKSVGVDMMKVPDTPKQYKPQTNIWGKKDYAANVRASQEKKNEVLELLGAAEHHWTYLTEEKRRKRQERVNEEQAAKYDMEMEDLYERYKNRENKIISAISAIKKNNDVAPKDAPSPVLPTVLPNGYHAQYGKHYKHDKLDPHSAEFMPPTGDPVIDGNIKKATNAKEKARKLKILLGKRT